jgi:hypothetical protein
MMVGSLAGLIFCELAARAFVAVTHRVPLIICDERAGWSLQPNMRDVIRGGEGGQFVINTDSEGHRCTRKRGDDAGAERPTVLLVGDSYVQSTGVEDDESFPWILAHETPLNVVNLGVLGYGTDQELVGLESYLDNHPTTNVRDVVVFVTANDFVDVQSDSHYLGRSKPRFEVVDGRLNRPAYHLSLSDRLMDISCFYWLANSQRALRFHEDMNNPAPGGDIIVACVAAMRETTIRRGARFHALVHHLREFWPASSEWWMDFASRCGGTDITERLRLPGGVNCFCYDGHHWNAEVHQRVASLTKELLAGHPD